MMIKKQVWSASVEEMQSVFIKLGKRMYSNSKIYREKFMWEKTMSPDLRRPMEDVWPIHMYYPHAWPSQIGLSEG